MNLFNENEKSMLVIELQSLEKRGIDIWMEGRISSSNEVVKTMALNEETDYMRDYIFEEGVLQEVHFDRITK